LPLRFFLLRIIGGLYSVTALRENVVPLRGDPSLPADVLDGVEDGLVGCFAAACVLLAGMDVIAERVDDVAAAGADALLAPKLLERLDRLPRNWQNHA
jgi:hypothetical protein